MPILLVKHLASGVQDLVVNVVNIVIHIGIKLVFKKYLYEEGLMAVPFSVTCTCECKMYDACLSDLLARNAGKFRKHSYSTKLNN